MPLVSIKCPHCESAVQVQVTVVARSRPCPVCLEPLMLQVAERSTGVKRKALLVAEVPPTDAAAEVEDAYEQKAFAGEAFDRMRADPDLARARRRLMMGVATVVGMVLVVTVWSLLTHWGLFKEGQIKPASPVPVASNAPVVDYTKNISPTLSRPMDFEQLVKDRKEYGQKSAQ